MQKFDSLLESAPKALRKAFEPPEQNVHSEFIPFHTATGNIGFVLPAGIIKKITSLFL